MNLDLSPMISSNIKLTHNVTVIQSSLICSKWIMDEILGLKFHLALF